MNKLGKRIELTGIAAAPVDSPGADGHSAVVQAGRNLAEEVHNWVVVVVGTQHVAVLVLGSKT